MFLNVFFSPPTETERRNKFKPQIILVNAGKKAKQKKKTKKKPTNQTNKQKPRKLSKRKTNKKKNKKKENTQLSSPLRAGQAQFF